MRVNRNILNAPGARSARHFSNVGIFLIASIWLVGCNNSGNSVDLVSAAVEPNTVAAPSVDSASPFLLKFRVGGEGADVLIKLQHDSSEDLRAGIDLVYSISCGGDKCLSKDVEVSCTSSLNASNSALRDIACENMPGSFKSVTQGSYVVRFAAFSSDARMFVDAKTDEISVPIEIK